MKITKKKLSLVVMLVGVLLLVIVGISGAVGTNNTELHKNSATISDVSCTGCHADKTNEQSLNPVYLAFHNTHMNSPLVNFNCSTCHSSTDIVEGSAASYRKQVSVAGNGYGSNPVGCMACHGKIPNKGGAMNIDARCADCHSNDTHAAPFVDQSQLNGESRANGGNCTKCHGAQAWYQTAESY